MAYQVANPFDQTYQTNCDEEKLHQIDTENHNFRSQPIKNPAIRIRYKNRNKSKKKQRYHSPSKK